MKLLVLISFMAGMIAPTLAVCGTFCLGEIKVWVRHQVMLWRIRNQ